MGIMPHGNIDKALELALSLDIPFWPQLPNIGYREDMYAQLARNFPGISIDADNARVCFDTSRFEAEFADYSVRIEENETFALSEEDSVVYHRFLELDLEGYASVRGQLTGPVSFGFKIIDENDRPIIYNDDVREILYDFVQRKANLQYRELRRKNENAFVWVDEPGLGWVFSSLSGYDDVRARADYTNFVSGLEGPGALHLCANVNLPYLLQLGAQVLSFDAYQIKAMPAEYARAVGRFIDDGGVISWGIVPTDSTSLDKESPQTLSKLLIEYWGEVSRHTGLSQKRIAEGALLAPARCCLKNIGQTGAADEAKKSAGKKDKGPGIEESLVERAFAFVNEISQILKNKYGL